jgi:hypothetical protein
MALRASEFVAAVTVSGERRLRVVFHELLPNMAGRVGAAAFFVAIQCTVVLTTLDFLASVSRGRFALGDTAGATWGSVLAQAQVQQALLTGTWWAFAFPALALVVLAAGLVLTLHGVELAADPRLRPVERRRLRLPRLPAPRLPRPQPLELRSPLPALRDTVAAVPRVLAVVLARLPLYLFVLWIAGTLAYALPRLAWRGRLVAPPPAGSFWAGYGRFLGDVATGRFGQGVAGVDGTIWRSLPFSPSSSAPVSGCWPHGAAAGSTTASPPRRRRSPGRPRRSRSPASPSRCWRCGCTCSRCSGRTGSTSSRRGRGGSRSARCDTASCRCSCS